MKSNTFNRTLLAVGVTSIMAISTGAIASTNSGNVNNGAPSVRNIATATYSVNNIQQPKVESNEVIVNITETANFTLYGMDGGSATDDMNENQTAVPGGTTPFKHRLINEGNISDTYTITTTGDNSSITTAEPNYALNAGADVAYVIKQKDGGDLTQQETTALTALGQPVRGTLTGTTKTIQLLPGLEAILTHLATTPTNAVGGNIGVGTLTATSQFITTANKGTPTLVNENQTLVRLPVFAITKTAACQSGTTCETLNLNAANTDITYKVKVANVTTDYSADATNVIFRDVLPAGMTLVEGSVKMGSQTIPATAYTVTTTNGLQTLQGVIPQLNVGQDLTVEFKVKVDKATLSAAGSAKNNITLYDNFDNSLPNPDSPTGSDITDSTDDDTDTPRVPADGPGTKGEDNSSTITFTDRNLTIEENDAKEIAVKGDEVTYTQTITNNGNANEGGTTRSINIKITDPTGDVLKITPPYYVNASLAKVPLTVVNAAAGEYLLPEAVILAPTKKIIIGYTVVSDGKSEGVIGSTNNDINKSETNIVTLTPGGTTAPAASSVTNTTTIKGVELIKTQALDAGCKGNVGTFGTATLEGTPKDCIVYRITANNTFSTLNVTDLKISDLLSKFSAGATYRGDASSSVSSTNSSISVVAASDGMTITTTVGTLTPTDTATLQFSVKIKE